MNIAPGDKIWYGDGHEGWVVDENIIYRTYPIQTDQLASCLKDWFFGRDSTVKKIGESMRKKCVCPKCGNNLVIEYVGNYGTIYAIRQDGKIGRKLKSIKYDQSSDGYMVYCPSCGEGYDGRLTDEGFTLYSEDVK